MIRRVMVEVGGGMEEQGSEGVREESWRVGWEVLGEQKDSSQRSGTVVHLGTP
jgi:hypothetical protein